MLLASTLLNAAYFAPVVYQAFFGKRPDGEVYEGIKEAPLAMVVPLMIAAVISVVIGFYPDFSCALPRPCCHETVKLIDFLRDRLKTGHPSVLVVSRFVVVWDVLLCRQGTRPHGG